METWPITLPQKVQRLFNADIQNGLMDVQEVINPVRTRTRPERGATFEVYLTPAEFQILRTFYRDTINHGALEFEAPWLDDAGFEDHFLCFNQPLSFSLIDGTIWKATMNLTIISGVPFDGGLPDIW